MADIKISELGAVNAVNNTDIFPMTSAGITVKATAQQIKNYMGVGNIADLNTTDKTSAVTAINEVDTNADAAQASANNAQQMIAPIQNNLTASKAYAVGEQFVYNGLLYKVTAAITQGGTITIDGNCELADSVTKQLVECTNYTFTNMQGQTITANTGYALGVIPTSHANKSFEACAVKTCSAIEGSFSIVPVIGGNEVVLYLQLVQTQTFIGSAFLTVSCFYK